MKDYIRDTYICFIKASKATQSFLETKYKDKKIPNVGIWTLMKAKSLTERLMRANIVMKEIFDPYNIYEPVKQNPEELLKNPDLTNEEIDTILDWKWGKK